MRAWLAASLLVFGPGVSAALSCEMAWPNPSVPIPPEVSKFIISECIAARGSSEETEAACIRAEGFGYQAQVALLKNPEYGEFMAARYRECRAGLGTIGGRFHRRRADCMGGAIGIAWRFEFTRETELVHGHTNDFAALEARVPELFVQP